MSSSKKVFLVVLVSIAVVFSVFAYYVANGTFRYSRGSSTTYFTFHGDETSRMREVDLSKVEPVIAAMIDKGEFNLLVVSPDSDERHGFSVSIDELTTDENVEFEQVNRNAELVFTFEPNANNQQANVRAFFKAKGITPYQDGVTTVATPNADWMLSYDVPADKKALTDLVLQLLGKTYGVREGSVYLQASNITVPPDGLSYQPDRDYLGKVLGSR